jgi:glycolate oxidase FAD binding subunit
MPTEQATLRGQLEELVGAPHVSAGAGANAAFAVDGRVPDLVVRPGSQDEVAQVVRACAEAGQAVIPWGGGTSMGLGNIPARADVVLRLDRLDRVVEWDPANLCVTVEAGMRLAALAEHTSGGGSILPMDPPAFAQATVGGMLACNQTGPGRLIYGTVRDWVLGLRVVLPSGERIRCGGRVIKNVSGYDMNKLFIKSLGTLGIITEATFKLLPLPAQRAGVVGVFPDVAAAWKVVARTQTTFLLPEALEFFDPGAMARLLAALGLPAVPGACGLAVTMAGSQATVDRQVRDFSAMFIEAGGKAVPIPTGQEAKAFAAIRDLVRVDGLDQSQVLAQVSVPVSQTAALAAAASQAGQNLGAAPAIAAHAAAGVVWARYQPAKDAAEATAKALEDLRRQAAAAGGSLVLHEAPPEVKQRIDAWGAPGDSLGMMKKLKAEFDPRGLFNPGRFVGGI